MIESRISPKTRQNKILTRTFIQRQNVEKSNRAALIWRCYLERKRIMKSRTRQCGFKAVGLALFAFTFLTWSSQAQLVVNAFNSSSEAGQWRYDFGINSTT